MDDGRDEEIEAQAFATGAWIYRDGFGPGTEVVRARVADALAARVDEVAAEVLAAVVEEGEDYETATPEARRVLGGLAEYTRQGTLLTASWVRTGIIPNGHDYRRHRLDQHGFLPNRVTGRIIRMVRSNLAFADGCRRVLHREVRRAGGSDAVFWALAAGVDIGFRTSLLVTAELYDRRAIETERALAEKEEQLEHQALHDPLTGLANRALLFDRLDQACERLRRHPDRGGLGVIFIDLDDFKLVNDDHGHAAGDSVLQEAARRLTATVRPEDTVARLGGDEFVVMCEAVPGSEWADRMARRITEALAAPFVVDGSPLHVTGSIGTAVASPPRCEVDALVRKADDAMYEAKRSGKRVPVGERAGDGRGHAAGRHAGRHRRR